MTIDRIHLLSVYAETGITPTLPKAALLEVARQWRGAGRRLRHGIPAGDLSQAGWGIVFPSDGDPRIREALTPLIRHREAQAGSRFQELTYRSGEGPSQFRNRLRCGFGPVNPDDIPYYLLLVGDATEIPHGFQAGLDIPHAVGRLHLPSVEAYGRYAESVRKLEEGRAPGSPRIALFNPTHGSDKAARLCADHLSGPLATFFKRREGGQLNCAVIGKDATRKALADLLASPDASLVLAAGHGVVYPAGHPLQLRLQGSLVCADWSGKGAVEMAHIFQSSVVPPEVSLEGRILFLFGCHTGGTPRLNSFDPSPRSERRTLTERAFVARLPQTLLERGALAVIAHVDQAFPDAFLWERYGQIEVFQDSLARILDGDPVGLALETFADRYAHIAAEIIEERLELGDGDIESLSAIQLWTAYHDTRGLVVLGDPAVRLARSEGVSQSGGSDE